VKKIRVNLLAKKLKKKLGKQIEEKLVESGGIMDK